MMLRLLAGRSGLVRCLATAAQATQSPAQLTSKEALMALRRKTGYPFVSCKKALNMFGPSSLGEAEKWLHEQAQKEGWGKVDMTDRMAKQGVVAAAASGNYGVVLELNCETDFVAKNEKFRALASVATLCSLAQFKSQFQPPSEDGPFSAQTLGIDSVLSAAPSQVVTNDAFASLFDGFQGSTFGDLLAFTLGYVKERLSLARVSGLVVPPTDLVVPYAHPRSNTGKKNSVVMGHFAAVVGVHRLSADSCLDSTSLGHQLSQHIIGMNPTHLGAMEPDGQEQNEEKDEEDDADKDMDRVTKLNDEKRLLHQEFLLNPSITVAQYLQGHNATVLGYCRFKCGEEVKEE